MRLALGIGVALGFVTFLKVWFCSECILPNYNPTSSNRLIASISWTGVFFFLFFFSFATVRPLSYMLLPLLIVLWAKGWFYQKVRADYREVLTRSLTLWAFVALGLLVFLHTWGSTGEVEWIRKHLEKYARFFYGAMIIMMLYNRPDWQRFALLGFVAAMLFTLASTWLNIWFLLPWSKSQNLGWGVSHHVFRDYIIQNLMMSLFVAIAICRLHQAYFIHQKILWSVIMMASIISITHLSQGRTGIVALFSVLLMIFMLKSRKFFVFGAIALCATLLVVLKTSESLGPGLYLAVTEFQSYATLMDPSTSIGHRLFNYQTTLALSAESPWIGHGTGAYHTEICRFVEPRYDCHPYNVHPHNQFLFMAADHGLIGILFYLGFIFSIFATGLSTQNKNYQILLFSIGAILVIDSLFNSSLWIAAHAMFFIFMISLLSVLPLNEMPRKKTSEGGKL